jgi:hypothetical protein
VKKLKIHAPPVRKTCNDARCKTCPYMKDCSEKFTSMASGKTYIVKGGQEPLGCGTKFIVYLTHCSRCGIQYVGRTQQTLRNRMTCNRGQGKDSIEKQGIASVSCPRLIEHFYGGGDCNDTHIRVQPIEVIPEAEGNTTEERKKARLTTLVARENYWIREMRTVFPYGMNDKTEGKATKGTGQRAVELQFYQRPRTRRHKRQRGKRTKADREANPLLTADAVFIQMSTEGSVPQWQNRLRIQVNRLHKVEQQKLVLIIDHAKRHQTDCKQIVLLVMEDLLKCRTTTEILTVTKKDTPDVVCKLNYLSAGTSQIRLGRLFKEEQVMAMVPAEAKTKCPVVVPIYTETTRGTILTHKKALRELTEEDWDISEPKKCSCEEYKEHRHKDIGHIMTGDFPMIKTVALRELLEKGSGHREPKPILWDEIQVETLLAIDNVVKTWSQKEGIMEIGWKEWKETMTTNILRRIQKVKAWNTPEVIELLDQEGIQRELKQLQKNLVFCPVDKAGNNILAVCKTYYQLCMIKEFSQIKKQLVLVDDLIPEEQEEVKKEAEEISEELREYLEEMADRAREAKEMMQQYLDQEQDMEEMLRQEQDMNEKEHEDLIPNKVEMIEEEKEEEDEEDCTYRRILQTEEEIVNEITKKLKEHGIEVPEEHKKLADMYMTGKMHKVIPKMRFIAASHSCVTKNLSALLTKILKQVYKQHKHLNTLKIKKTGISHLWVTDSKESVLQQIEKLNEGKKGISVDTYDFETLYTNIPHRKLKSYICEVIQEAFDSQIKSERFYINPAGRTGSWTTKETPKTVDCKTAKGLVCLLIDNIYVKVGGRCFKQTLGIPMGTDCAPYLANLYLYARESEWIAKNLKAKNWHLLKHFKYCSRYIDDLVVFNNDGLMAKHYKDIYGELRLSRESEENGHAAHFLEVDMLVETGFIHTSLYDKRDDFNFRVVTFPTFPANIEKASAHGLIIAQFIRFAQVCDRKENFFQRAVTLTDKLLQQGFDKKLLRKKCHIFYERNQGLLRKYIATKQEIINGTFS